MPQAQAPAQVKQARMTSSPKEAKRTPSKTQIMQKDRYDVELFDDWHKKILPVYKIFSKSTQRRAGDNSRSRVHEDDIWAEIHDPAGAAVKTRSMRKRKASKVMEIRETLSEMMHMVDVIQLEEDPLSESDVEEAGHMVTADTSIEHMDKQGRIAKDPLCLLPKQEQIDGDDEEFKGGKSLAITPQRLIKVENDGRQMPVDEESKLSACATGTKQSTSIQASSPDGEIEITSENCSFVEPDV